MIDDNSYGEMHRRLQEAFAVPKFELPESMLSAASAIEQHQHQLAAMLTPHIQALDVMSQFDWKESLFASMHDALAIDTSAFESLTIHPTWPVDILGGSDILEKMQQAQLATLSITADLGNVARMLQIQDDWAQQLANMGINEAIYANVPRSLATMDLRFDELATAAKSLETLTAMPSFAVPGAGREVVLAQYTAKRIAERGEETNSEVYEYVIEIVETEVDEVHDVLARVHPDLAAMYRGARQAFDDRQDDYPRHVLTSVRELWNNLLRILCPENELLNWIDGRKQLLHDDKPTRAARMQYVCRAFESSPLASFLKADAKVYVEFHGVLSRLHNLEPGLSDSELELLLLRSEQFLEYVLRIHFETE